MKIGSPESRFVLICHAFVELWRFLQHWPGLEDIDGGSKED
jgi:hypothetical protein